MAFRRSLSRPFFMATASAIRSSTAPPPSAALFTSLTIPHPYYSRVSTSTLRPLEALSCTVSPLPLHTGLAVARLRSHLSTDATTPFELSQGSPNEFDIRKISKGALSKARSNQCDVLSYIRNLDVEKKELIKKMVNMRMSSGNKRRVRTIFDSSFRRLARSEGDVVELLTKAVENTKPLCEIEKIKRGGTAYDVPVMVGKDRQQSLAIRWILDGAEQRRTSKTTNFDKSLTEEIVDASRQRGNAYTKKKNLHKLASAKRRFAQVARRGF